ncbi:hypothetical protein FDP41_012515 [Naegleria fowleri]|uniref:tRNA-splicing endonuclease subunit Sen54 N-terminal domain-containing protein n=1 Tax=Naegleria fowleri TaxID=5763 RepID=A0A6A5C7E9_NAEFO|nr:uncharacterized protein FDP41_012515 [Naegleria fowleri]KAF0981405.1 hypothetical protein FDP41_012515 [Naegleria fowleri]
MNVMATQIITIGKIARKDISIGEFIPEENAVKTIQMKGKIGSDMGFTIRKENLCERIRKNPTVYVEGLDEKLIIRQDSENAFRFLHIEEALYLIDVGSLILIVEKEPYQLCHLEIQEKKLLRLVITSKQQNKANSRVLWSTFEWFSQQTANDEFHDAISPLIYNLELKDEQLLEQQQLFNTLNIIKCGLCSYSSPMRDVMNTTTSADSSSSTDMMDFSTHSTEGTIKAFEPIMFDVWKPGVSLNDSPSMIIIVTSFSNSTVPTINDIFKVSEQGARFNQIPIFHCVIGESGSVMFMNLCPCEIENLLLTPLMPSQATSDTTTTMTTMLPSDHTDQYNRE